MVDGRDGDLCSCHQILGCVICFLTSCYLCFLFFLVDLAWVALLEHVGFCFLRVAHVGCRGFLFVLPF